MTRGGNFRDIVVVTLLLLYAESIWDYILCQKVFRMHTYMSDNGMKMTHGGRGMGVERRGGFLKYFYLHRQKNVLLNI